MSSSDRILTLKRINLNGIGSRCEPFGAYVIYTSIHRHFTGAAYYNMAEYGVLPTLKYERYSNNAIGVKTYCDAIAAKLTTADIFVGNLWNFIHHDDCMSVQNTKTGARAFRKYMSSNNDIHTDIMNMCRFAHNKNISFEMMFANANELAFRMYLKEYITFGTVIAMATITDMLKDELKHDPLIVKSVNHISRVSDLFIVNSENLGNMIMECKEMFNLT